METVYDEILQDLVHCKINIKFLRSSPKHDKICSNVVVLLGREISYNKNINRQVKRFNFTQYSPTVYARSVVFNLGYYYLRGYAKTC